MKIIDRKTFLAMPAYTLFSKWKPCSFGPLEIKGETWGEDYLTQQIADAVECSDSGDFFDKCCAAAETGESLAMDLDCPGRDGCFDLDQKFAVWEREDILALLENLAACKAVYVWED